MFNDNFKLFGEVWIELNGVLVRHFPNMVVNAGLDLSVTRVFAQLAGTVAGVSHMGLGTSSTAPVPTQNALLAPIAITSGVFRKVFDAAPTKVNQTVTVTTTFGAGQATGNIAEAAMFNALTGGSMFSRVSFNPIQKSAVDSLKVIWNITAVR